MRIVAFDLETTDLKAMMGVILVGGFMEIFPPGCPKRKPYTLSIQRNEDNRFDPNPDKELVVSIRDELEKYNLIVGWNSKMFDVPMLNARLAFFNERPLRTQFHLDLMYYAGGVSNRIGSRKLENVQKYFNLERKTGGGKTEIDWDMWKAAALGEPEAMAEVIKHCEQDVKVLAEAYWRLLPSVAKLHR